MTLAARNEELSHLRSLAEKELRVPATLHSYQWDGVAFLYRAQAALLADEMGLGKTVQAAVALALLLQAPSGISRAIIVAPASLTLNWMRELTVWAPSVTTRVVSGDARGREAYYLLPIPVLVASYEQIRMDALDRIPRQAFDLVVLDEAQRIKNRDSATALACRLLPRRVAWALTATPLENAEADLSSILSFLDPSLGRQLSRRRVAIELGSRMLRRRKTQVRAELPPVILQDLALPLADPQRKAYDELWFDRVATLRDAEAGDAQSAMLGLITRLKILCNFEQATNASSKLDALRVLVEGAGAGSRILVFSQFVQTIHWIAPRLQTRCDFLIGSMSVEARDRAVNEFQEGPAPRVLLVSLRAGGVGLNLGNATLVVLFDRWWNPAVEIQAIYRAHRFDRGAPLHVVRFLVEDSIEERIGRVLRRKEELFREVVESIDTPSYHFTAEELMQILEINSEDLSWPQREQEAPNHGKDRRVSRDRA